MTQDKPPPRRIDHWARFRLLVTVMFVAAAVAVVGALYWLKAMGTPLHTHMIIATALGVGAAVAIGGVLMALVFVSAHSGIDDEVEKHGKDKE